MSTSSRIIKNTSFLYLKMGITMFVSLLTTRLLLNSLGVSDFGIYNIVGGAISMLGFLNVAMASATQRFLSYSEGANDKDKETVIFNASVILHFIIAIIISVMLIVACPFLFDGVLNIQPNRIEAAKIIYYSLIISTAFTMMTVPYDAVMNAHENMLYYSIIGVVESLLKLIVTIIVVYTLMDKLIVYGILMSIIPFVTLTVMRIYCKRNYKECNFSFSLYFRKDIMKEMTSFAGWNFLSSFSSIVGNYGNGIVLNHFFGTVLNTALGVANQLSGQLSAFSQNMMKAINPVIVKSEGAGSTENMLTYSYAACRYSYLLILFFAVPFAFEAPYILKIWLKNVPEWGILFFRFQVLRNLLEQLTGSLGTAIGAKGKIKGRSISSILCNLIQLPILYIIFKRGGTPAWYFIVILITMVFLSAMFNVYFCKKTCGMKLISYYRNVLVSCLSTTIIMMISCYIVLLFFKDGLLQTVFCFILTSLAFILSYRFFASKEELVVINTTMIKIKNRLLK